MSNQEQRDSLDRDYTPPALARRLVDLLPILPTDEVLEPHVGGGAFARALLMRGVEAVVVNDLDPHAPGLRVLGTVKSTTIDFLDRSEGSLATGVVLIQGFLRRRGEALHRVEYYKDLPYKGKWDWIVGNPPYKDAESHCRRALELSHNVAFLLRLGFLGSKKRIPFFEEHPPSAVFVIQGRPNFREGRINKKTGKPYGTDNSDYAFIVWGGWPNKSPTLQWVAWEKD